MVKSDFGFVYKSCHSSFYTITNCHGKIILNNNFFVNRYPSIRSFFFVIYEYNQKKIDYMIHMGKKGIFISEMEIEHIVLFNKIDYLSSVLVYILDYCFLYHESFSIDLVGFLLQFYENDYSQNKMIDMLYDLLFWCNPFSLIEKEIFLAKNEKEKIEIIKLILIEKEPYHKKVIDSLFNSKGN